MNRADFMEFFRDDDFHSKMSTDDCIEVFLGVLKGNSDITVELLNELISDYSVENLEVIETPESSDTLVEVETKPKPVEIKEVTEFLSNNPNQTYF